MSVLFNMPWQQAFDGSGNTIAGARLYFYEAGTSTPKMVYADVGLGTPLPNPVIANGSGRFPPIYLEDNGAYKVRYCTDEDVEIWTADNVVTESQESDVTVVLEAITQTSISAGYTEEQAQNPTNFVRAVYKYANSANWFEDEGTADNVYILTGLDDYIRLPDYFEGQNVWFVSSRANTGSATVNVDSLGTKNIIRPNGETLQPGDVYGLVHLVYNGASFVLQTGAYVSQHGEQTIYDTKTFDESPLMPTADLGDSSTKGATTEFVQQELKNKLYPDFSNVITQSNSYTPLVDGWVTCATTLDNNGTAAMSIGGVEVWKQNIWGDRSAGGYFTSGMFFVPAGVAITTTGSNTRTLKFYPLSTGEEE